MSASSSPPPPRVEPSAPPPSRRQLVVTVLVTLLALAAVLLPLLALPAAVATFLAFVVATREPAQTRRLHYALLSAASAASLIAFVRFIKTEAVAGIVQGGTRATETRAVSRLREILFAEDVMRRHAEWDPDGDQVGSAALVSELTGELGLRGERRLAPPLLESMAKGESTSLGPAHLVGGYWFAVCLPTRDGGFSAEPGAAFDDEQAERRFIAYAWPAAENVGLSQAFSLDEHERILVAEARPGLRMGSAHAPPCDDAVAAETRGDWRPWQDKKPRKSLPGDRPEPR